MSLLSRNTRGGRRPVARMAAVFAGTLLTYLVVTAVPAFAVSSCTNAAADTGDVNQMNVNVGTDDSVVIREDAGVIQISQNGGAFAPCAAGDSLDATVDFINVVGSNAGNESFTVFNPVDFADDNMAVNLLNGTDNLFWEYGALASPATADPTPGVGADAEIMNAASGEGTGNFDGDVFADLRIINAENQRLNGDTVGDSLNAGTGTFIGFDFASVPGSGDATFTAVAPYGQNLTLNGGTGDDFLVSGNGNDTFLGAAGSDVVSYEGSAAGVSVDLQAGTGTGMGTDTLTDVQDAAGSVNNDTLLGSTLNNNIFGDDGDDVIDGREGADGDPATPPAAVSGIPLGLSGGNDDDTLTGGVGNDRVRGQAGDDVVNEGAAPSGADFLEGGPGGGCDELNYGARTGNVTINENTGPETYGEVAEGDTGGGGFEIFVTGAGADVINGDSSAELAQPGAGNDTVDLNANGGTDSCDLGLDYLDLSVVPGPAVFNLITGTATGNGTDTFFDLEGYIGGPGNDSVVVGDTNANGNTLGDFVSDGGDDTVDATANTLGIVINLAVFGNGQEVENALGGSGNDTITGNVLNNRLIGNDGNDFITAGTGNDFVEGGQGNDILNDGGGADKLSYRHAPAGVTVDLANGFASGGDGEDTITGGFEIVLLSNFNDTATTGQTAFDAPFTVKGFKGNDSITGSNSTDTLKGGAGNDDVRAGGGDDLLSGAAGNDLLLAGTGDDRLKGGKGTDRGVGGRGFDVCSSIENETSCEA